MTMPENGLRPLPHNLEAERSVLGAILLHDEAYVHAAGIVQPQDFFRSAHQMIFRAMASLAERNVAIDLTTIKDTLVRAGDLDAVGGPAYIAALVDGIPRSTNVEHYATLVRDYARKRAAIFAAGTIIESAYTNDPETTADDILSGAQQQLLALADDRTVGFSTMQQLVDEGMAALEALEKNRGALPGLPSGFPDLDELTCGFQPGNLIVVAGRPGMGKTSLALNIAEHVGVTGRAVAGFSLEMSKQELFMRMLSGRARVDGQRIKGGRLSERDYGRIATAISALATAPIFIDDTASIALPDLSARCHRLAAERGLDLVFVDYLQLMKTDEGRSTNREQAIARLSRGLKRLAKDLHVPVIVLSQLSRAPETRSNHRPQLSDLRESGAIEQDADVVLFVYRDEQYRDGDADAFEAARADGTAEIIVGKQRSGPTGIVKVAYLKSFTRFESIAREETPRHV
jgi:replicative DNA helicase